MPFSDAEGKDWSAQKVVLHQPEVIADLGPGCGTYSDLLRDKTRAAWYGYEIFAPYIEQYDLRSKYDTVYNMDVRDVTWNYYRNGLVIAGDILEHMDDFDARLLVYTLKRKFRWILVSIPIVPSPQGECFGNIHETHHKDWSFEEMHQLMDGCHAFRGNTLGVYWWERP